MNSALPTLSPQPPPPPNSCLISLMFRAPDTLRFVILAQGFISGEDSASLRTFIQVVLNVKRFNPNLVLIDDSMAERGVIEHIWPNAKIFFCIWHVKRTLEKHFHHARTNKWAAALINHRHRGKWLEIYHLSLRALHTISEDKFNKTIEHIIQSLKVLEGYEDGWWNPKSSAKTEREWFEKYVKKKNQYWALCKRLENVAGAQVLTTGDVECYHSILKEGDLKASLKKMDLLQSFVQAYNATKRFNQFHSQDQRKFFDTHTTNFIHKMLPQIYLLYPKSFLKTASLHCSK